MSPSPGSGWLYLFQPPWLTMRQAYAGRIVHGDFTALFPATLMAGAVLATGRRRRRNFLGGLLRRSFLTKGGVARRAASREGGQNGLGPVGNEKLGLAGGGSVELTLSATCRLSHLPSSIH